MPPCPPPIFPTAPRTSAGTFPALLGQDFDTVWAKTTTNPSKTNEMHTFLYAPASPPFLISALVPQRCAPFFMTLPTRPILTIRMRRATQLGLQKQMKSIQHQRELPLQIHKINPSHGIQGVASIFSTPDRPFPQGAPPKTRKNSTRELRFCYFRPCGPRQTPQTTSPHTGTEIRRLRRPIQGISDTEFAACGDQYRSGHLLL